MLAVEQSEVHRGPRAGGAPHRAAAPRDGAEQGAVTAALSESSPVSPEARLKKAPSRDPDEKTMIWFGIGMATLAVFAGVVIGIAVYATG
jgi:hypothetical protein